MAKSPEEMKSKWANESKAADAVQKAVQVAFDLDVNVQKTIKIIAVNNDITPGCQIRKILGLEFSEKPTRQRISVSFSENDFELLAKKYGLDPSNRKDIKRRAHEEITKFTQGSN